MRRLAIIVVDPLAELREHRLDVPEVVVDVVAFKRVCTKASARPFLSGLYAGVVIATKPSSCA